MKAIELRKQTNEELASNITEYKKKLFDLRLKMSTGGEVKASEIDVLRKDIARMKTILSEREMEVSK